MLVGQRRANLPFRIPYLVMCAFGARWRWPLIANGWYARYSIRWGWWRSDPRRARSFLIRAGSDRSGTTSRRRRRCLIVPCGSTATTTGFVSATAPRWPSIFWSHRQALRGANSRHCCRLRGKKSGRTYRFLLKTPVPSARDSRLAILMRGWEDGHQIQDSWARGKRGRRKARRTIKPM